MNTRILFESTADILGCRTDDVKAFCIGNEGALKSITPQELALQIKEYEGDK